MEIPGYQIQRAIGRGGMSHVFLAKQRNFDRPVALKIMSPQFANNAQFKERFVQEARIVAQLNHPHIVQVHDVGTP